MTFKEKYGDHSGETLDKYLMIRDEKLTSLEGCYKEIKGFFSCSLNNLEDLSGGPEIVHGNYYCYNNNIKTFLIGPKEVHGNFVCFENPAKPPKIMDGLKGEIIDKIRGDK